MPSKGHTLNDNKSSSKQRPANSPAKNPDVLAQQQTHPTIIIQRAKLEPLSLAPQDILQLQRTIGNRAVGQLLDRTERRQLNQEKQNQTDLPESLKDGVENLSGISMNDVNVHYNSPKPARLQALAYTHGTDIYVGPGQEKHLPHEAWHVVQQKQGRVKPTLRQNDVSINDDKGLEQEADVMGAKALQTEVTCPATTALRQTITPSDRGAPVQLLSKTVDLGNSQTANIEYNLGAAVEETNGYKLSADFFQELGSFICSSNLDVTLSADTEQPLEFGFFANTMSSVRTAFYNSTKRTKGGAKITKQTLDGDGAEPPFAIPPARLPKTAGTHSIRIRYVDNPLCLFSRKDPNAEDEGNTLVRVSGRDVHKVWLVVGNPNTGSLIVIYSIGWEVTWDAKINNISNEVEVEGGGNLRDDGGEGPIWEGELAEDSFEMFEETW